MGFIGTLTNTDNSITDGTIQNKELVFDSVNYGGVTLSLGGTSLQPAFDLTLSTNYPASSLVGTITNDQLAGSISNDKLANSSVSYGGVELNLGSSDPTPAFDLTDATNYQTSNLVGTITNSQLAGSISNDKLANSSVSYGGVTLSLGGVDATPEFDLSDATNYPYSSLTGITTEILGDTTPQLGGDLDANNFNIQFADSTGTNNNRAKFGISTDLQIYHDGSDSWIDESGPGNLYLKSNGGSINFRLNNTDQLKVIENAATEINYGNSKKFETTASGVEIFGSAGIGTDNPIARLQVYRQTEFADNPIIQARSNNGSINELKFEIDGNGDAYFNGSVGIGTDNPRSKLDIQGTDEQLRFYRTGGDRFGGIRYDGTQLKVTLPLGDNLSIEEYSGTTELLRVSPNGEVNIGAVSPISNGSGVLNVYSSTSGALSQFVHSAGNGGLRIGGTGPGSSANLVFSNNYNTSWTDEWTIRMDGSDDSLQFLSGGVSGTERVRIDSSGRLLLGATSARSFTGVAQLLQIEAADGSGSGRICIGTNNNDNAAGPGIYMYRSRGGSLGSNVIVQDGDDIGSIYFHGADGTDVLTRAAQIRCEIDGTPGSNVMPAALLFSTTNTSGSGPNERMRITSSGLVGIGTDNPSAPLDVFKYTNTSSSATGTTLLNLTNNVGTESIGGDLNQQKTFIDFTFKDSNSNEVPQVRIGAEVGANFNASSATLEGSGAFVVYTNNSDTDGSGGSDAGASLTEKFRVDYAGVVSDSAGGLRTLPQNAKATSYTLIASDVGKHVSISSGNITVPQSVFSIGDIVTIYNNSASSRSIIQGTGTTLRKAGTVNTGTCSLSEYGTASILCVATNVFVVSGNIV